MHDRQLTGERSQGLSDISDDTGHGARGVIYEGNADRSRKGRSGKGRNLWNRESGGAGRSGQGGREGDGQEGGAQSGNDEKDHPSSPAHLDPSDLHAVMVPTESS